jgi:hypothetical protein
VREPDDLAVALRHDHAVADDLQALEPRSSTASGSVG